MGFFTKSQLDKFVRHFDEVDKTDPLPMLYD